MNIKRNSSNIWPYVIVGSAVGGAVAYLFMTESGRKIRRAAAHPGELADKLEDAGDFLEQKARIVTDRVDALIDKAKRSVEEGERAYREAGENYRSQAGHLERKNSEVASRIHSTVDTMSRNAVTIEQRILEPIVEIGAVLRGLERGIRSLLGRTGRTSHEGPFGIRRGERLGG
jgi:gas vesicle protein